MSIPKFKFFGHNEYFAWHLLPTIRFGHSVKFGFLSLTWLKFDAGLQWEFRK